MGEELLPLRLAPVGSSAGLTASCAGSLAGQIVAPPGPGPVGGPAPPGAAPAPGPAAPLAAAPLAAAPAAGAPLMAAPPGPPPPPPPPPSLSSSSSSDMSEAPGPSSAKGASPGRMAASNSWPSRKTSPRGKGSMREGASLQAVRLPAAMSASISAMSFARVLGKSSATQKGRTSWPRRSSSWEPQGAPSARGRKMWRSPRETFGPLRAPPGRGPRERESRPGTNGGGGEGRRPPHAVQNPGGALECFPRCRASEPQTYCTVTGQRLQHSTAHYVSAPRGEGEGRPPTRTMVIGTFLDAQSGAARNTHGTLRSTVPALARL